MPPDWLLLILLFIGIAIMPMYDQARMMTPFEYFAGGLGALFQSGEFVWHFCMTRHDERLWSIPLYEHSADPSLLQWEPSLD